VGMFIIYYGKLLLNLATLYIYCN